ncbi:SDR family oxidoreductase [bacterium]|nr:SDR family oxidoreductase [bacterium]
MDLGLTGKTALVCGASRGLGYAAALELAAEGANVVLCSRTEADIRAAADRIHSATGARAAAVAADVAEPESAALLVRTALERFGALHVLVTNAGGPPPGRFESHSDAAWQKAFELNLLSAVRLIRECIPPMRQAGWGRIVNITSVAVKQPIDGLILSNSVRAGVIGLAKTLSNELARDNILVNNVCPGFILTDRTKSLFDSRALAEGRSPEEIRESVAASVPLGRLGEPRELAALVAFLCSERASYLTGTSIQVDGGLLKALM